MKILLEMPGVEPQKFRVQCVLSTTELNLQLTTAHIICFHKAFSTMYIVEEDMIEDAGNVIRDISQAKHTNELYPQKYLHIKSLFRKFYNCRCREITQDISLAKRTLYPISTSLLKAENQISF